MPIDRDGLEARFRVEIEPVQLGPAARAGARRRTNVARLCDEVRELRIPTRSGKIAVFRVCHFFRDGGAKRVRSPRAPRPRRERTPDEPSAGEQADLEKMQHEVIAEGIEKAKEDLLENSERKRIRRIKPSSGRSGSGGGFFPFRTPKDPFDLLRGGLLDWLSDAGDAAEDAMDDAVRQSAFELRDAIVEDLGLSVGPSLAGMPPAIDTGGLAASITVVFDEDGLGAAVGTDLAYAQYLEFGTLQMSARPFLFPAFERMKPRIVQNCTDAATRGIRDHALRAGV